LACTKREIKSIAFVYDGCFDPVIAQSALPLGEVKDNLKNDPGYGAYAASEARDNSNCDWN
jgi:hypothetical protein